METGIGSRMYFSMFWPSLGVISSVSSDKGGAELPLQLSGYDRCSACGQRNLKHAGRLYKPIGASQPMAV